MEASDIWLSCHPSSIRYKGLTVYTYKLGKCPSPPPSFLLAQKIRFCFVQLTCTATSEMVIKKLLSTFCFFILWTRVSEAWQEAVLEPQRIPESGPYLQRDRGGNT